jgi:hypothetical protein
MTIRTSYTIVPQPTGPSLSALLESLVGVATTFGLIITSADVRLSARALDLLRSLRPYLLEEAEVGEWPGSRLLENWTSHRLVYRLTADSVRLLSAVDALDEWVNPDLPEDLHLMRDDRSTVLGTIAQHEYFWLELDPDEAQTVQARLPSGFQLVREPSRSISFRDPTGPELDLLRRLVSADFPGADVLAEQLTTTQVASIDTDGSLLLRPGGASPADVIRPVPVEATYPDIDGVLVIVILHVVDGLLDLLQIYRDDDRHVQVPATEVPHLEIESLST